MITLVHGALVRIKQITHRKWDAKKTVPSLGIRWHHEPANQSPAEAGKVAEKGGGALWPLDAAATLYRWAVSSHSLHFSEAIKLKL